MQIAARCTRPIVSFVLGIPNIELPLIRHGRDRASTSCALFLTFSIGGELLNSPAQGEIDGKVKNLRYSVTLSTVMAKLLRFGHSAHGAWLNLRRPLSQFMRPALLNPLFAPLRALPGVGPKTGKLFDRLLAQGPEEARVLDALFHLPHSTIDRRSRPKIAEAERDIIVTLEVVVTEHRPPPGRNARGPYRVLVEDETGDMLLVFFKANHDWIERMLPLGAKRWVSGRLELWEGHLQMVHPDRVLDEEGLKKLPPVEPVYGLTEGLYQRNVQKAVDAGMERTPALPDWLDPAYARARKWPGFLELCAPSIIRKSLKTLIRGRPPASVSPLTNCSPTSWHW